MQSTRKQKDIKAANGSLHLTQSQHRCSCNVVESIDWKFRQEVCNDIFNFLGQKLWQPKASAPISCFFSAYSAIHLHQVQKLRRFRNWFASWNWTALENTPFATWTHVGTAWSHPLIAPYQSCAQWPENHPVVPILWRFKHVQTVSTDPTDSVLAPSYQLRCLIQWWLTRCLISTSASSIQFSHQTSALRFRLLDRCEEGRTHTLIALGDV